VWLSYTGMPCDGIAIRCLPSARKWCVVFIYSKVSEREQKCLPSSLSCLVALGVFCFVNKPTLGRTDSPPGTAPVHQPHAAHPSQCPHVYFT